MRQKQRFAGLPALLFFLALAACGQQEPATTPVANQPPPPAPSMPDCRLAMGWDVWTPYQYRDAQGAMAGLDVEIARAAATAAACEIEFVEEPWMTSLNRLRDGEIQLLAGATRTPGREEFAVFTAPYRSESFVVYTLADNEAAVAAKTLRELLATGATVGTVAEYYYGAEFSALLDDAALRARLKEAATPALNHERLLNGEIDAFIEDPFVASAILSEQGMDERIVPTAIVITAGEVSFMLSKAGMESAVIERFQAGMEKIRADGRLREILDAYREM